MRFALLDGSDVVNVISWDGEAPYETDLVQVQLEDGSPVSVGWTRDAGGEWVAPEPPALPAPPARDPAVRAAAIGKLKGLGLSEAEALAVLAG